MKIVFLGTNGWYTTPTGNTSCVLINSKHHYVIFDAGNGIYKIDKFITDEKPISLFLTHFHIDHVSGLHTLAKFNFPQGINVYIPKRRKKDFDILVANPYTIGYKSDENKKSSLRTNIRLHELAEGSHSLDFEVEVIALYHADNNHGYRVKLEDKIIAYSGDTGVGPNSIKLARNADVLIHECSFVRPNHMVKWGHVYPEEAATLAKKSGARQLALTHFAADLYTSLDMRKEAEEKAKKIFPNTLAAVDDKVLKL